MLWGWVSRFLVALGLCAALAGAAMPAAAQTGVAGRPLKVCVLRDTGGVQAAELIAHPERFDCATAQHALGPGNFWAISETIGLPSRDAAPLNVRFASLWQKGVSTFILYGDGTIRSMATDARGVTPFLQLGAVVEQPLPSATAPVVRVLWQVQGAANMRGVVMGARLSTARQSQNANLRMATIYAAFAGLCGALILHNLALWRSLRHPFQLKYCLMATCLLAYAFSSSGTLSWVFPDIANNDRLRINYLLLSTTGASGLFFAKSFFEDRIFAGWLGRYTDIVSALLLAMGVTFFLTAPFQVRVADAAFTLVFLGLATVVGPMLWRAWRLRSNYLWLYAIGWGVPILTAILRAMANLHIIPWNFWLDNSTILAMAVEALMSALAIAYRIKLLRDERDDAIASEVMARRLADIDPLTGLLNRRAFLNQAIGREGEQVLLIADLDHFKGVNETLGHDGGDEVLRVFSRMLRTICPASALVARLGGEEFAILAHSSEPVEANAVLAKLRVARMPFDIKVTTSIGACRGMLTSEVDWKTLYRGADKALFDAKAAGRDRARDAVRHAA